jgi:type VI secretion system secreted protein Hcp
MAAGSTIEQRQNKPEENCMALFDAFLKLDGIKGESADDKHKGEIDVMSFSWGAAQTGTSGTGGGGGAGKVHFQDIHFIKKTDASSPLLMLNCANGSHIKEGTLVCRKAGGTQLEYLKIKLTDVLISGFQEQGSHSSEAIPVEKVSLNFAKVEYSYQAQGADGKAQGGPVMAGWDVKANKKV